MGQPVAVKQLSSYRQDIVRFEMNRAITGMASERYERGRQIIGTRPPDALARRLFELDGVQSVHINASIVTVELGRGGDVDAIAEIIENLYIYYRPGVEPPTL